MEERTAGAADVRFSELSSYRKLPLKRAQITPDQPLVLSIVRERPANSWRKLGAALSKREAALLFAFWLTFVAVEFMVNR